MEEKEIKKEFDDEHEDTFFDDGIEGLDSSLDELAVEIRKAIDESKVELEKAFNELIKKIDGIDLSKEKVNEYINQFKKSYQEIISQADEKIKAFAEEQKDNEYWLKVKEVYGEVSEAVISSVTDTYNKAKEVEGVQKTIDSVNSAYKEAYNYLDEKYQQFIHNEDVKRTVVGAVDFAKALYQQAVDYVNDLNKEKEE